ncbi:fibronectin type III domain-containing protein [Umezawaea sp. NPDC059074]|uniref:fibronectin type III domain-containing protein n=1 Tax=Umezawaea sp. NPDC059074 TaxID=3346716 RepID=UPI003692EA8B
MSHTLRTVMQSGHRKPRAIVAVWTAAVVAAGAVVAVAATGDSPPALAFQQAGHWVYNGTIGALFHVDGGTKQVDAKADGVEGSAGSTALQGDRDVFLVSGSKAVVFGKSTLSVDTSYDLDGTGEPVGIEVVGGPYAVYRDPGTVVRFGKPLTTVKAGGPLADPVATPDGTVWLQRRDSGEFCRLSRGENALGCAGKVPDGHRGGLAVVGDRAVFVDTSAGYASTLDKSGLGASVDLNVDLPDDARIASHEVGGRLPVLDPQRSTLLLADVSGVGSGRPAATVLPVALDAGEYSSPVSSTSAVSLVDYTRNRLLTFDSQGNAKSTTPLAGTGKAKISRGEDGRVYVDDPAGEHVLVVDGDGAVTSVDIVGKDVPTAPNEPLPPPDFLPPPQQPQPPQQPLSVNQPVVPVAPEAPQTPEEPVVPPAAPADVQAQPGNQEVTVSWGAPSGAVSGYRISWRSVSGGGSSGETTVAGNQTSAKIAQLKNGAVYVFTVLAENSAGRGPGADSPEAKPSSDTPGEPKDLKATAGADGTVSLTWTKASGEGNTITEYSVTATGSDRSTVAAAKSSAAQVVVPAGKLQVGLAYTFTATATNDLGLTGAESSPSAAVTPYQPAAAPGTPTATAGDRSLAVAWTAPDLGGGDLVGYEVSAPGLTTQTTTTPSATFTGLTNSTAYTFTIHAITRERGRTSGPTATGANATATGTPGTTPSVQLVSATSSGDRQITATVAVDDHGSGQVTCQVILNGAERWRGACGGTQGITIGGLDYATNYDVYVQPSNSFGLGPVSGHLGARTNDPPPPPRTAEVAKGAATTQSNCSSNCYFIRVALRNFAPNSTVAVHCNSTVDGDYYTYSAKVNASGASDTNVCYFGYGGKQVWVVADGVTSNRVTW